MSFESISFQCQFVEQYLKPYLRSVLAYQNSPFEIKFESLSGIITKFAHKQSCNELEIEDVGNFTLIFKYCAPVYKKLANLNIMLYPSIEATNELQLSPICRDANLIESYKYLIEKDFYFKETNQNVQSKYSDESSNNSEIQQILHRQKLDKVEPPIVRYTSLYMSVNKRDWKFLLPFYQNYLEPNFLNKPLVINDNRNYHICGLNFDIKYELFNIYIWSSFIYLLIAIIIILLLTFIYVKSSILTLTILLCVCISMLESFFIYKLILRIEFFSFMNIMSMFLLIGISCDNAFIIYDIWSEAKFKFRYLLANKIGDMKYTSCSMPIKDNSNDKKYIDTGNTTLNNENIYHKNPMLDLFLENCVDFTFKNGICSILTTNFTTAVGFLVNLSSSIIAIRLFGLYSALAILANLFLIVLIIPCFLVMKIRYSRSIYNYFIHLMTLSNLISISNIDCVNSFVNAFKNVIQTIREFYENIFEKWLPNFIVSFRYYLVVFFVLLGVTGLVLMFYKPGLQLPNSSSFQFLSATNPLEYYDKHFSPISESNGNLISS